jgi:hypothetical protein
LRCHTVNQVSVSTVNLDKVESNLLAPLDCLEPLLLVVLNVLCAGGDRLGVEAWVERAFRCTNDYSSALHYLASRR